VTQPLRPRPYSVGEAKGSSTATPPEDGSLAESEKVSASAARKRNDLPFTLMAWWPQGMSSVASG
jgi:hypothetical protein